MSKSGSGDPQGDGAGQAIDAVLQAERDAARAVRDCELQAQEILEAARGRARRLITRADQRVSLMQQRCNQRLEKMVRAVEKQEQMPDDAPDPRALGKAATEDVLGALAAELTGDETAVGERRKPG